jgi:NAD(P)-dependent dehydrogenase (short-subunit alcohol dehydrogenase family)
MSRDVRQSLPRGADTAALHATFDLVLRALASQPAGGGPRADAKSSHAGEPPAPPDALVAAYQRARDTARDMATRDPLDAIATVVGTCTLLFYLAEKGKNPRVRTVWDALNFITSSLSVGYDQLFPKTPAGKAITSFVMTVGPSLAARALDPPKIQADRDAAASAAVQRAVLERLDSILEALRAQPASPPPRRAAHPSPLAFERALLHPPAPMKGKTVIVTGANAGIGKITAGELASMGAKVTLVCRDKARGDEALRDVREKSGGDVELMLCDFGSFESIRAFAAAFKDSHDRLDVLVNNAGAIIGERKTTADGFEMTFGVNHLGYFLLTNLLLDLLKKSAPSRIVNVSSAVHAQGKLDWDDLQHERKAYGQFRAYADSKLCNILFTNELARRLQGTGVAVNSLHPGAVGTNFGTTGSPLFRFLTKLGSPFLLTAEKGARTSIYLASSPDVDGVTGKYFAKSREAKPSKAALDAEAARRLWDVSAKMVGLTDA